MSKSVFALIVGSVLSVSALAPGAHAATMVDLSTYLNSDISTYSGGSNYPAGGSTVSINSVDFTLGTFPSASGHAGSIYDANTPTTTQIIVNIPNVNSVFTLINSGFGVLNQTIGQMSFIDSNNNTYTFDLTEGLNVRDHFEDGFNNTATALFGSAYYPGPNPGPDRLDAQQFILPGLVSLKEIDFISYGFGAPNGTPFLTAITAANVTATPIPAGLSLFATALGAMGLAGWYRKKSAAQA